LKLLKKSLEH
jgi:hypothetical protein